MTRAIAHVLLALCLVPLFLIVTATRAEAMEFTAPEPFLVDKSTALVAIVEIEAVATRWTVIEHGDHIPVLRVTSRLLRPLVGSAPEPGADAATRLTTLHYDYTEMIRKPITPPPVIGRPYLLFADPVVEATPTWVAGLGVDHIAHAQGSFLLRGEGDDRYIYWEGRRYFLRDIETALGAAEPFPLAAIDDPETRREIAAQRLGEGELADPADFVAALLEPIETEAPFQDWYESLALLRRAARQEALREKVLEALRPRLTEVDLQRQRAIAVVLAEQGDAGGKAILQQALAEPPVALNRDPDGGVILPNRLPYDASSTVAAAWALGRLGERAALDHADLDVRLAAAGGLLEGGAAGLREALLPIAAELDLEVEALREEGALTAPRTKSDRKQRYPHHWVRVHQLLSRLGDDASLRRLAEAQRLDAATYPPKHPDAERDAFPRMKIALWSSAPYSWPSLRQALTTADPDPETLLARLAAIYGEDDALLASLRAGFEAEPEDASAAEPAPGKAATETLALIAEQLAAPDPKTRARGFAGAGFQQVDEHFDLVLETALDGEGVERRAALYGLGFYDRELPPEALHRLTREGELAVRFQGLELATREHPEPFAEATIALLHELAAAGEEVGREARKLERIAPRIVSRFCRSEIPAPILGALADEDPKVAILVAMGLGLGGNPDALVALQQTFVNRSGPAKQAAKWALEQLGVPP